MKTLVQLSLSAIIALSFIACGGGGGGENKPSNTPANQTNQTNQTNTSNPTPSENCNGGNVINGFTMPPCPDKTINDSTLLGIDANNNGVRDDVERWLINRYKNDHKIVTEIGMQGARAYQVVLQNPNNAKETTKLVEAAQYCNFYFSDFADVFNEPILTTDDEIFTSTAFRAVQFNTKERIRAYFAYDKALSGGVYKFPKIDTLKSYCTFDTKKLLGK